MTAPHAPAPLRVYLAGPITLARLDSTRDAARLYAELARRGHAPYLPHGAGLAVTLADPLPEAEWLRLGLAWLRTCDVVVRLPGESAGADAEVAEAERLGLPVVEAVRGSADWMAVLRTADLVGQVAQLARGCRDACGEDHGAGAEAAPARAVAEPALLARLGRLEERLAGLEGWTKAPWSGCFAAPAEEASRG